jgi:yecA family protein
VTDAFAYAELDEILRGAGRTGAIGMSAIDGLIAALVAAPSFVHPEEWIPLIFGGRQPLHENSPELHAVKTIFNRYNEVSETFADWPPAYRPIFMVDDDGSIIAQIGQQPRAALVIGAASLGEADLARRAVRQPRPQPFLEFLHMLADHAGRNAEPRFSASEAAALDHLGEDPHIVEAVHEALRLSSNPEWSIQSGPYYQRDRQGPLY